MSHRLAAVLMLVGLLATGLAAGHEVRPALLRVTETSDRHYEVLWKGSLGGMAGVRLVPHISGGLLEQSPTVSETGPDFLVRVWRNLDAGAEGLEGRTLYIEGLEQSLIDVLVTVTLADGDELRHRVAPQNPSMTFRVRPAGLAVPAYVALGIEHILTGIDHLAFVLGLMLLAHRRVTLLLTMTAFTVGHSLSLAATTLRVITIRSSVVESLVPPVPM